MANKVSEYFETLQEQAELFPDNDGYDIRIMPMQVSFEDLTKEFSTFLGTLSFQDIDTWFDEAHQPINDYIEQNEEAKPRPIEDSWLLNVNQATLRIVKIKQLLRWALTEYRNLGNLEPIYTMVIYEVLGTDPELFC